MTIKIRYAAAKSSSFPTVHPPLHSTAEKCQFPLWASVVSFQFSLTGSSSTQTDCVRIHWLAFTGFCWKATLLRFVQRGKYYYEMGREKAGLKDWGIHKNLHRRYEFIQAGVHLGPGKVSVGHQATNGPNLRKYVSLSNIKTIPETAWLQKMNIRKYALLSNKEAETSGKRESWLLKMGLTQQRRLIHETQDVQLQKISFAE